MRLLDQVDTSINSDQPLLSGLSNSGPVNIGMPMNLPTFESSPNESGTYTSNPALLQTLEIEDDDEWSDTDPMQFEDEQIYENSAFLGIRIGKKAKAKGAAKKAARVAKKQARKAAKQAEVNNIGSDSVWKAPNEITPANYNPLAAPDQVQETPALLSTINDPASTFKMAMASNTNDLGKTGFENETSGEYGFDPDDYDQPKKVKKNNTLLYVGIGVAALVVLIVALKARK